VTEKLSSSIEAEPGHGPRVLVVEDSPINRELAVRALQRLGARVDSVENGAEAVSALAADRYDIVFMDLMMPVMNGLDATRAIRAAEHAAARSRTPIVALTAQAIMGDRQTCLDAGMDDYMTKPFTRAQIADMLARWTGTSRKN
jgi:CheY-like chemotaxis protein